MLFAPDLKRGHCLVAILGSIVGSAGHSRGSDVGRAYYAGTGLLA